MKKVFIILIFLSSCTPKQVDVSEQAKMEIIQADKDMSNKAAQEGFFKTLLMYADDGIVVLKEGVFPVIGKSELTKYWSEKKETKEISWEPFKAEAARSGEMGYTLGNWKFVARDSVYYGNYYTIWKKQRDGSWKFVLDGGNGTPVPENGKN
jgi:ketosteroid isomerase-like protein